MWIVRLALRRPYTVATLCLMIAVFGALSLSRVRVDVLPSVDIPVAVVVWNYPGLIADEMEKRVIYITERALSTTIGDIERIDSQSIDSIGVVKVYFQPGTEIGAAIAQITSVCNTVLRVMPPGITPPAILQFNASNVPVAQLTVGGQGAGEQELFDYGLNVLRLRLFTITGTTLNVESFMGAIMAVGIATSNSILLVSFANDARAFAERDPGPAAAMRESGRTRLRPVLMTALAMILGMLPMALGLGEGGEQNAPLGRAVIGGLLAATFTTLFLVPVVYTFVRRRPPRKHVLDVRFEEETREPAGATPAAAGRPA